FIPRRLGLLHRGEDDARPVIEAAGRGTTRAMELLRLRGRAGDEDLDADSGQRGEVRLELALDVAVVSGEGAQFDPLHHQRRDVETERDELQRRNRSVDERVLRV